MTKPFSTQEDLPYELQVAFLKSDQATIKNTFTNIQPQSLLAFQTNLNVLVYIAAANEAALKTFFSLLTPADQMAFAIALLPIIEKDKQSILVDYIPQEKRIFALNTYLNDKMKFISYEFNTVQLFLTDAAITQPELALIEEYCIHASNRLGIQPPRDRKPNEDFLDFRRTGAQEEIKMFLPTLEDYLKTNPPQENIFTLVSQAFNNSKTLDVTAILAAYAQDQPIFIPSGWTGHHVGVILYKNYLIVGNRGAGIFKDEQGEPYGTVIFSLKQDEISESVINQLLAQSLIAEPHESREDFNLLINWLKADPLPLALLPDKGQKRGTCSFTNCKAASKGLMAVLLELDKAQNPSLPLSTLSSTTVEQTNALFKPYADHYRNKEIDKLLAILTKYPKESLTHQAIQYLLYDYIEGHFQYQQEKDQGRLQKIFASPTFTHLTANDMQKFKMDFVCLIKAANWVGCNAEKETLLKNFACFSAQEKEVILAQSHNLHSLSHEDIQRLAHDSPSIKLTLFHNASQKQKEIVLNYTTINDAIQKRDEHQTDHLLTLVQPQELKKALLELAIEKNNKALVEKLGLQDFTPTDLEKGLTTAVFRQHAEIVELLLQYPININVSHNLCKITPLMSAVRNGNEKIVTLLLNHHPQFDLKSVGGETAMDMAKKNGNSRIIQLLQDVQQRITASAFPKVATSAFQQHLQQAPTLHKTPETDSSSKTPAAPKKPTKP